MSEVMKVEGHTGTVYFDGSTIRIERKKALGRLSAGKGEKIIPLAAITSVQVKPAGAMVNGFIQFTVPGGIEGRGGFGSQTFDAVADENSIIFRKKSQAAFEALRDAVQHALAEHHQGTANRNPVANDAAGKLKQLGELRDSGVITGEEFEAKKAELLDLI